MTIEEEKEEHRHLPMFVVPLPHGTAHLQSSRQDSAVKYAAMKY